MESGADVRYGFLTAGGLLVALGWGLLVLVNLLLHRIAPSDGIDLGVLRVYPGFGVFAWAATLLGTGAGLVGAVLVYYGTQSPKGRFVLPGTPY